MCDGARPQKSTDSQRDDIAKTLRSVARVALCCNTTFPLSSSRSTYNTRIVLVVNKYGVQN